MTPELKVLYDERFLKTVYALRHNENTAEWRNGVVTDMLERYFTDTDVYPNSYVLEKLADYILSGDPTFLNEAQLKRRDERERSNSEISA